MAPTIVWLAFTFMLVCSNALLVRKDVDHLTPEEVLNLQKALREVSKDTSSKGFAAIAAYHGYPPKCKHGSKDVACCVHGEPTFPQWHRLYAVQMEQALKEKGLNIGIPYWEWTHQLDHLPELVSQRVFIENDGGKARSNIWYQGQIPTPEGVKNTARAVDPRLFQQVETGQYTDLFEHVLNALEYPNYCQFEVQFEVAHNTIHYLVGGRHTYSVSHLEYTSYDPIFFLHHSNVDKIYTIYETIQRSRGYTPGPGCTGECELCDIVGFRTPLEPLNRDSNPFALTRVHSHPYEATEHTLFGYKYDNLTLNGLDVDKIKSIIEKRQEADRAFASFRLHGIGVSADVRVKVCVSDSRHLAGDYCEFAGNFFILGGPLEMPWTFNRPYYCEITKTVEHMNISLTSDYHVEVDVYSVNGTQLPSDILPHPSVSFRPGVGKRDPEIVQKLEHKEEVSIRKDVDHLTREEILELREALEKLQSDHSVDGYQAIAEFHGDPGKCPFPTARDRFACCIHGMPNFPHWHRLLVVQVEDALRRRGAHTGIPYWDWTKPNTHIPALAADETYVNPHDNAEHVNPFHHAVIGFLGGDAKTSRDPLPELTQTPKWGDHTELFDVFLLALEQDNFCDFEVQFEIAHNLIHAYVGGNSKYGLSSLSYSAFDPIFYLHHSNIDRIWAIWTALQQHRGKPYKAHCAQSYVYTPLKPFAFHTPYNNNEKTFAHSTPTDVYDYEKEFQYGYDNLQFGGLGIPQLENYINEHLKSKSRTFVGIHLHGIKTSGLATIHVSASGKDYVAGHFAILGGPSEMDWDYDRPYRHDISHALEELGVNWAQPFDVTIEMHTFDNKPIDVSQFPRINIIHKEQEQAHDTSPITKITRKNVNHLTEEEILNLRHSLAFLEEDRSVGGYQTLGRFHGTPNWCPYPSAEKKVACCPHGGPTFPHWHRLLTVQAENALRKHGYKGALPYWDWTQPATSLPAIVVPETYIDPSNNQETHNPFHDAYIDDVNQNTVRSVRSDLYQQPAFGEYTDIAKQVLYALEQDNYCDFEVQYEIAHNFIHALVGGSEVYSMASLLYTAFDPLFYLHHSNTDRIWAIWQALQAYRGKPENAANCAIGKLRIPLPPFSLTPDVNPDPVTREHSSPLRVFNYKDSFQYEYDTLDFSGLGIPQLAKLLEENKADDRVFAGFLLHGVGHSALVTFFICRNDTDCHNHGGEFYILGDPNEMEWSYDRLYKYEITEELKKLHLRYNDRYFVRYEIHDLTGQDLGQPFPTPTVIRQIGTSHLYGREYRDAVTVASHVRKDLDTLTAGEIESLRSAFLDIQQDHTYENIASFHGKPGLCQHEGHKVACCVHGMPTFLSWHRLYVEQVEEALLDHGSSVAVPYFDWISPIQKLPDLISKATYYNSREQRFDPNPFFSGKVAGEDAVTTRDPQPELFNNDYFYEQALYALEQDNFCDFEIQFEVLHNALHSWLGGHAKYSFSSLDYTAFDPVFFLHHANTDRLWAIWQELQRYRGLPYNEADCAINLMRKPLQPFQDKKLNPRNITNIYSRPADTFDCRNHFHYEYDTLELNHQTVPQLENLLKRRQEYGRVFAGFLIHNIGLSADVTVYVCVPSGPKGKNDCNHKAGVFSVLGGELEMPFTFDRLYMLQITDTIKQLGLKVNNAASYQLKVEIKAVNGTLLDPHILPDPSIIFEPGTKERQAEDGDVKDIVVRKNVDALSPRETLSLIHALEALQADSSADGYQSIAAFHAVPPLCPSPSASTRYACCLHGMSTFPQWHRLYTVQVEDALRRHGSVVGIPYWDWTRASQSLPHFLSDNNYTDPYTKEVHDNPWHGASIDFEHSHTERDIQSAELFKLGPHGWDTWLFEQALLALEQEDYCDFEIQFEITHNAIHSWVGGSKEHSLAHLHYASYDPAFYIHHSNTDRLWAIWQALQKHRGYSPNEANCALEHLKDSLKPFSFGPPYNLNKLTTKYSHPEDTFAYEDHFEYQYDSLEFVGMNIPALDAYIKERQEHDRVFAGFLLHGLGTSASVEFTICDAFKKCFEGGHFTVLGGELEKPWQFDRLYRYPITDVLKENHIHYDDDYHFHIHIKALNGTELDSKLIPEPSVLFVAAHEDVHHVEATPNNIRRNLNTLEERDIQSLQAALRDLQRDTTNDGWANLASFHGAPARCPDPKHPTVACCVHGMPTFPHWHRLFALQIEQALHRHGSSIALPYWDWTLAIDDLPSTFTKEDYYDVWRDEVVPNPFAHGYVASEDTYTVRDIQETLHDRHVDGKHSFLFYGVLEVLEQTDYCDFEVHFEVVHNAIHYLIGGHQTYSLSSLEYSAYDPIFFIHHSFTDKLWAVWQELQKRRHLPYNRADCALNYVNEPLKPFSFEGFNLNKFTREHAVPNTLFNNEDLGYAYDNFNIGGYDLDELEKLIHDRQIKPRIFAGFLLKGIKTSGSVNLKVCKFEECTPAGFFNLLGGPLEMPWAFDRLFKKDITWTIARIGLNPDDIHKTDSGFKLEVQAFNVEGTALPLSQAIPKPSVTYKPALGVEKDIHTTAVAGVGVRKDVTRLTVSETENLREAPRRIKADNGSNGFQSIASFHGSPPGCVHENHSVACRIHGMANFPQWHRLYVKQWEDALTAQGAKIGIPYWDWTTAFTELPALVTEEVDNPFHHGTIYNGEITTRAPRDKLFNDPEFGKESFFYRQVLLAFEQTDYCDFEVQYEISHNAIHSWTGGQSPYGMSTLEYTAYDPLFLLHHSNVDRQFAIWQALQKFRGLPYNSANCAIQLLHQPMRPFSDADNVNPVTRTNSRARDVFNYDRLNYQYDDLNFHGLSISELNDVLERRKEKARIFAEFLLHGIGASADVTFDLCDSHDHCEFAGTFAILGGPLEHPWAFDRLFKYDVTDVFSKLHLRPDSEYHFNIHIVAVNGTELDSHLIRSPTVQFVPGVKDYYEKIAQKTEAHEDVLLRKNINELSLEESANLRSALNKLQQDQGPNGFEAIAGFHGAPFKCPENGTDKYACCVHGMSVFPHWHRLLTVQFEQALKAHGAKEGVPYWDWTAPIGKIPSLFGDSADYNPFYSYTISFNNQRTTRDIQSELYNPHQINGYNYLYYLALSTLEEDNFCDFEVQYEVLHNEIHALIGGNGTYSMATLDFSAFEPFFMIHHSSLDRIWIIWQELQKLRHKPFNYAHCGGHVLDDPLHPFSFGEINKNDLTRLNSQPSSVFDYTHFGYEFDKLELNGHDVQGIDDIIHNLRHENRVYLGFVLFGQQSSLEYKIDLIDDAGQAHTAGSFHLLGGEREMPWAYERLFKYDITDVAKKYDITTDHPIKVKVTSTYYNGEPHQEYTDEIVAVERHADTDYDIVVIPVSKDNTLVPKIVVKKGTRIEFVTSDLTDPLEDLGSYTTMHKCKIPPFSNNSYALNTVYKLSPGDYFFVPKNVDLCNAGRRIQITVEDD
uniref:Hemocyanin alphaD-subunit n=1 Tax=Helix lucorum TaxID=31229 RepID=G3FPE6_HELLU|nr:hemocyanin alphaD-subunit [Helix lucorum]